MQKVCLKKSCCTTTTNGIKRSNKSHINEVITTLDEAPLTRQQGCSVFAPSRRKRHRTKLARARRRGSRFELRHAQPLFTLEEEDGEAEESDSGDFDDDGPTKKSSLMKRRRPASLCRSALRFYQGAQLVLLMLATSGLLIRVIRSEDQLMDEREEQLSFDQYFTQLHHDENQQQLLQQVVASPDSDSIIASSNNDNNNNNNFNINSNNNNDINFNNNNINNFNDNHNHNNNQQHNTITSRALLPLDSNRLILPQMQQIKSRFNQGCVGGTKCQFFAFCWMSGGSLGASCGLLMTCCVTPSRQEIQPGFYGPVVNDPCKFSASSFVFTGQGEEARLSQSR